MGAVLAGARGKKEMGWLGRFKALMGDWRYHIKEEGWRSALPRVASSIVQLPYCHLKFVLLTRSLLEPLPDLSPKIPLEIRPFQPADLDFARKEFLPSEAGLCEQHIHLGHHGLVACLDGQVAGYGWGCTDTVLERIDLKLEPGDVLCTDAFTAPAFRGKGVQTTISLARLRAFQEAGYKRAVAYIEIHNKPSLAVWKKIGAEVISQIDFKRIDFWRITRYS